MIEHCRIPYFYQQDNVLNLLMVRSMFDFDMNKIHCFVINKYDQRLQWFQLKRNIL